MGKTILISSHILPELQDLCNKVGIIEQGELLYSGPWTDIVKQAKVGTILHVGVAPHERELAAALLAQNPNVENVAANNGNEQTAIHTAVRQYSSFTPSRSPRAYSRDARGVKSSVKLVMTSTLRRAAG